MLCAEDAHNLDVATLTLLRLLVWASGACAGVLITMAYPSREQLGVLLEQAQVRLWLPPMST